MPNILASCICSSDPSTGANRDNLLFAEQLLPERNGGLAGAPSTQLQVPFAVAVFHGYGPAAGGAHAAHKAANALRDAGAALASEGALAELLFPLCAERLDESGAPMGCSAAAVFFTGSRLHLASCGICRAYLLRDRSLFLLTPNAGPEAEPYSLSGVPLAGDRLLLCTGILAESLHAQQMLELLHDAKSDADALQQLLRQARSLGAQGSVTAIVLRFG